ncbi:hypothetical protein JZ751_021549 [Albula glossodonta]|uniref:Secreted protein n=1 Tax=Albula glossodonta TaxID=121402 RepID=A0A8T2NL87_9TELE|nr:hypothetical protein JZ751_021549 [Albula glossodonta]
MRMMMMMMMMMMVLWISEGKDRVTMKRTERRAKEGHLKTVHFGQERHSPQGTDTCRGHMDSP